MADRLLRLEPHSPRGGHDRLLEHGPRHEAVGRPGGRGPAGTFARAVHAFPGGERYLHRGGGDLRDHGEVSVAVEHFEDALVFCRKAGYRPELAWSCCDFADTLLQCDQPGDREKATSLLEQSLSIASDLGMKPLMARVATRLEKVKVPPPPAFPDRLTAREVEVLRLITDGKRNRQIGEALHISLNTVANHVTNIFNKSGSTNRAEATAYAYRHHIVRLLQPDDNDSHVT